jgi:hypothetical protein
MAKRLGLFNVWKVPEIQKQANLLRSVKNQMKGGHLENPWNQRKTCPGSHKTIK